MIRNRVPQLHLIKAPMIGSNFTMLALLSRIVQSKSILLAAQVSLEKTCIIYVVGPRKHGCMLDTLRGRKFWIDPMHLVRPLY